MKLAITTLTAAVIATAAAADVRYEAVTPMGADTPVLNIPESNERYQSVNKPQSPEVASQSNVGGFENPNGATPEAANSGLEDYQNEKDRLQNIFR